MTNTNTARLTDARLGEIRARLAAATPGPWEVDSGWADMSPEAIVGTEDLGWVIADCRKGSESPEQDAANAALIAHAPSDIETLLREVEALRAERDEAQHDAARWRAVRPHLLVTDHDAGDGEPPVWSLCGDGLERLAIEGEWRVPSAELVVDMWMAQQEAPRV